MTMRACVRCRLAFVPRKPTQVHCTAECGQRHRSERAARRQRAVRQSLRPDQWPCGHCGVAFNQPRPGALYCSDRCQQIAFNVRRTARRQATATGLPCRWCGHKTRNMSGFCKPRCRDGFGEWRQRYLDRFGFAADW